MFLPEVSKADILTRSRPLPRFGSSGEFLSCNYEITAMKIDNYEIKKEKLRDEEAGDGCPPPLSPWEPHLGGCVSVHLCTCVTVWDCEFVGPRVGDTATS